MANINNDDIGHIDVDSNILDISAELINDSPTQVSLKSPKSFAKDVVNTLL